MAYRRILRQEIPEGKVEWQGITLLRLELKLLENGYSNLLFWTKEDGFEGENRYRVFVSRHGLAFLPGHFLVKRLFSKIFIDHIVVRVKDFDRVLRMHKRNNV